MGKLLRKMSLALFCLFFSTLAVSATINLNRGIQNPNLLWTQEIIPWLTEILEPGEYRSFDLSDLYTYQIEYGNDLISLDQGPYLINFNSSSVLTYLGFEWPGGVVPEEERDGLLREVSGRTLALILYTIGGDGTDHSSECREWVTRTLPARPITKGPDSYVWSAMYTGFLVDFVGHCTEYGRAQAQYVRIKIAYDEETDEGQILISGERVTSSLIQTFLNPQVDVD